MNDEERQRTMDFILGAQAKFTTDAQELKEADARAKEADERAVNRLDRLERVVKLMVRAGRRERRDWRERYTALLDSQMQNEERFATLAESQAHTDQRLNALIDIVSETRGGGANGTGAK